MRKNKLIILCSIILLSFLLLVSRNSYAQTANSGSYVPAADSNDAIAVRIVPNPAHSSIATWYENQGFTGSPQALTVDGYDAIRDGRTVYVGAANVSGKAIYTNIYLISYNQDPSVKTVDILGQIIKNWKFNTDLAEKNNPAPSCAISSSPCLSNTDCAKDQVCATSGITANSCQLVTPKICLTDTDCPQNFFCNSVKAKIIRDVKRIGKTEELNQSLNNYKINNGFYPKLQAGTYLSGYTVSAWPSWSEALLPQLGMTQSFIDPINRLGACSGFDVKTCWNSETKRFVYDPQTSSLMLPAGSYGFVYKTDSQGSSYNLCSVMETRENTADLNFQFSPNIPANSNCVTAIGVSANGTAVNTPPRLVDYSLKGDTYQEFSGYFNVIDDQNNPLTWSLKSSANYSTWSGAPVLKDTTNPNQKKVYALKSGLPGSYPISLVVSDGQGGVLSTTTSIIITNPKPNIEAGNASYLISPSTPFSYSFYFSADNLALPILNDYTIATTTVTKSSFDILNNSVIKPTLTAAGTNRYQITYQGIIPTSAKFSNDTDYFYRLTVKGFNTVATKDFKITLKVQNPILNLNCLTEQRFNQNFSCLLGPVTQEGYSITYSGNTLPAGLKVTTDKTSAYLSGVASANPSVSSSASFNSSNSYNPIPYNYSIKATNEYGASSTQSSFLKVNTYCGDGIKQSVTPNSEGRGGIYNDGYEDCDGADGVATSATSSSVNLQYGCATFNASTPYPIVNNSYCVYKSPIEGGGFCGDRYCQVDKGEDIKNCPQDCLSVCVPNCSATGKDCGDNGCGGSCGKCNIGSECYGGSCCLKEAQLNVINSGSYGSIVAYFNGKNYLVGNYDSLGPVSHSKNVLAIRATGFSDYTKAAIVTTLKQVSEIIPPQTTSKNICLNTSTSNLKNWLCSNTAPIINGKNWYDLDYDASSWKAPNSGFINPYANIWALDFGYQEAYCRYTFTGDATAPDSCTADSSNKECGANGCGGFFRPNNCPAINSSNNNFYCGSNNKCTCDKLTCDSKNAINNVSAGKQGSACGSFNNNCNGTTNCGDNCDAGLYCNVPQGQYGYNSTFAICNVGKPNNTCQKKCWWLPSVPTKSITVKEGDILEKDTCAVKALKDNPDCGSTTCPSQCSTQTYIGTFPKGVDSCCNSYFIVCTSWVPRKIYTCTDSKKALLYYGDPCTKSTFVDASGNCSCLPSCASGYCGDNGCGGLCACSNGKRCDTPKGTCTLAPECLPDCSGKNCGSDGCGATCGTCASGSTCNASGSCISQNSSAACSGKNCGSDGAGGSCGVCKGSSVCSADGICMACSKKQCSNYGHLVCGTISDGCGSTIDCGDCSSEPIFNYCDTTNNQCTKLNRATQ